MPPSDRALAVSVPGWACWPVSDDGSATSGTSLLARDGIRLNHKRVFRPTREETLGVRKRGGRKRALGTRSPMVLLEAAIQRCSLDFVPNAMSNGVGSEFWPAPPQEARSVLWHSIAPSEPQQTVFGESLDGNTHHSVITLWRTVSKDVPRQGVEDQISGSCEPATIWAALPAQPFYFASGVMTGPMQCGPMAVHHPLSPSISAGKGGWRSLKQRQW